MKQISDFLSENFPSLVLKFSIYLNRCVFVMCAGLRYYTFPSFLDHMVEYLFLPGYSVTLMLVIE